MEENTPEAFANRDAPIPVIAVTSNEAAGNGEAPDTERKRDKLMNSLGGSKLKDKIHDVSAGKIEPGHSIQDHLFTKLLQQVIPTEDVNEDGELIEDKRSSKYIDRPGFSLPLMTNNFRKFNARCGILFVAQTRLIRLLSWKTTSHTLSLLAVCTFACLDPYLLAVLPLALALLFVMVPAFLVRHPPKPSPISQSPSHSLNGPPRAPPPLVRPAAEMSKDFFRNMRDLQNTMNDFSTSHDLILDFMTPLVNFSDEALSSAIFLLLFVTSCALFITAHLLPWRFISLFVCWTGIALGHPRVQELALASYKEQLKPHERTAKTKIERFISCEIVLNKEPEIAEVEIFELQRRKGGLYGEWEPWAFWEKPYDPLSPERISGERPNWTRSFEDVAVPDDKWEWADKKWVLDLDSKAWVEHKMLQGVEVELEGERWVGDLLGEGYEEVQSDWNAVSRGKGKRQEKIKVRDWEEGTGTSRLGEWRRRRWIRMAKEKVMLGRAQDATITNQSM